MLRIKRFALITAALAFGACGVDSTNGDQLPPEPDLPKPGDNAGSGASGGEDNTFDHDGTEVDVWELIKALQEQGPMAYQAKVHGCSKLQYRTLGNVLESRGVDLAGGGDSAGRIWRDSEQALGGAKYSARQPESRNLTAAAASRLFDIFMQAAPEIIANMPDQPECQVGGQGAEMFSAEGQCTADGITCLIGFPATAGHIELCNLTVSQATTPEKGRVIAVAALAAAAHTCE